jgi:hypothetical protein
LENLDMNRSPWLRALLALVVLAPLVAWPAFGVDHTALQQLPIQLGSSGGNAADISHTFCCSGTLGALILLDGIPQILSNNHVLARSGLAAPGEAIIQPGLVDNGCSAAGARRVAVFHRDWLPLGQDNVDVAVARAVRGRVDPSGTILDLGIPCTAIADPAVGMTVEKSGRSSGLTTGNVQAIDAQVSVDYQPRCGVGRHETRNYDHQVVIAPAAFSMAGDSGSLIVSTDLHPVALLYAGNVMSTIAHPIRDVVDAFQTAGHTFAFVGARGHRRGPRRQGAPSGGALRNARRPGRRRWQGERRSRHPGGGGGRLRRPREPGAAGSPRPARRGPRASHRHRPLRRAVAPPAPAAGRPPRLARRRSSAILRGSLRGAIHAGIGCQLA